MRNHLGTLLLLTLMISCQQDEISPVDNGSTDLYGKMESVLATKTTMDENNNVLWSEGDQLAAFMGTTLVAKYQIKEQYVGSTTGGFSKVTENGDSGDLESGQEIDHNVIWYPYSDDVWCMKNDTYNPTRTYKLNVVLPQTQAYAVNSFANRSFPMIAVASSNQLTFRNVCGGVKLQFKGVDKIKSIKLEGLGEEALSGKATVIGYVDGSTPTIEMSTGAFTSVILDCGDGVQLKEDTPTTFIITLPPVQFNSGMRITVTDTDGLSRELTNSSSNVIKRSSLLTFPVITYAQKGVFEFPEDAVTNYEFIAEGGTAVIPLVTNQGYRVIIPEDAENWITLVETKALREETISFLIAENDTSEDRFAEILIATTEGVTLQTITIQQESSELSPAKAIDLSPNGTANCYIINEAGRYKFKPTKGNSSETVGVISNVEILWESFGNDVKPVQGDLIQNARYANGVIVFETSESFRSGNAVIAAKDVEGNILWSWHIWCSSERFREHSYSNNAGVMMDRNLGATSAEPGDASSIGLLYQWGRKDPFIASSHIKNNTPALTTANVQYPKVISNSETGTIEYSILHPTTFIYKTDYSGRTDWSEVADEPGAERWQTVKTIYDPCPYGWKVPEGGENGVWQTAGFPRGVSGDFDRNKLGMTFSPWLTGELSWYPASGGLSGTMSSSYAMPTPLHSTGYYGRWWTSTLYDGDSAYALHHDADVSNNWGYINTVSYQGMNDAYAVRCIKEGTGGGSRDIVNDLSNGGTEAANCYFVGHGGTYTFPTVKGNSNVSVGEVTTAEVLWESRRSSTWNIIEEVKYSGNTITFKTSNRFQDGNAVIAAKDASGKILWSWHIWFSSNGYNEVKYGNNAGIMMDRNLGATSAQPGVPKSLGLLYQWGRKDPFLSSANINDNTVASSTLADYNWSYTTNVQSIEYSIQKPCVMICASNEDWCTDENVSRWDHYKTIYDPCPAGWRVPDGGENGIWVKSDMVYSEGGNEYRYRFDSANRGITLLETICTPETWYPAAGHRGPYKMTLESVGVGGCYWTCTTTDYNQNNSYYLNFDCVGLLYPTNGSSKSSAHSVRCQKE